MEYSELFKALLGLLSAISTVAVYKFNIAKSLQARAVLMQQFEEALKQERKYSVCELFWLLHGSRMNYENIIAVTKNDNVSTILFILKKTPGMVKFVNGELQYSAVFENKWVRLTNTFISKGLVCFLGAITIILIIAMAFAKGITALIMLVFLIPCFAILTMEIKSLRHDHEVHELINENAA